MRAQPPCPTCTHHHGSAGLCWHSRGRRDGHGIYVGSKLLPTLRAQVKRPYISQIFPRLQEGGHLLFLGIVFAKVYNGAQWIQHALTDTNDAQWIQHGLTDKNGAQWIQHALTDTNEKGIGMQWGCGAGKRAPSLEVVALLGGLHGAGQVEYCSN